MQAVRQRDIDGIQVWIGDQRLAAVMHPGDAVFGGKGLTTRRLACRHRGHHHHFGVSLGRVDERQRCNAGRTQDANPHGSQTFRHGPDASS